VCVRRGEYSYMYEYLYLYNVSKKYIFKIVHCFFFILDNGKIILILILALKEVTTILNMVSKRITTKYNHWYDSDQD
jgi:hypothetical protein